VLLTYFLKDLLTTGDVTITGRPAPFEPADLQAAEVLLRAYHADDTLALPGTAPAFDAPAALWAAAYLYYTMQLTVSRELDETAIEEHLRGFAGPVTPEVIYSTDLLFRYLPDLLRLAKGLAPGDALVARLHATARQWPLSFVGQEPGDAQAEATLLAHPALRQEYLDRIIGARDRPRASQSHLTPLIHAALGGHAASLWPDFEAFTLLSS